MLLKYAIVDVMRKLVNRAGDRQTSISGRQTGEVTAKARPSIQFNNNIGVAVVATRKLL